MNWANAVSYLVGTLIDLYITAVLLRLLLQWVRADFYNPLVQFLVTITNPPLKRLRRLSPSIGRLDTASVVLLLALEIFGVWLVSRIAPMPLDGPAIVLLSVQKLLMTLLWTYFFLIIIAVVLSWIGRGSSHPLVPLVYQLTRPVLAPIQRFVPPVAGFDLSPLIALIAIRFLLLLLGW
jgi:YggT family protein